jgi:hypothetical protein
MAYSTNYQPHNDRKKPNKMKGRYVQRSPKLPTYVHVKPLLLQNIVIKYE